jgi:hypothetical protein
MAERERLPNRRDSKLIDFICGGFRYTAGINRFADGRSAEIFTTASKCGSDADTAARDSAVVASIARQYGVPLEVLRRALMRDAQGPRQRTARNGPGPDRARSAAGRRRICARPAADPRDRGVAPRRLTRRSAALGAFQPEAYSLRPILRQKAPTWDAQTRAPSRASHSVRLSVQRPSLGSGAYQRRSRPQRNRFSSRPV